MLLEFSEYIQQDKNVPCASPQFGIDSLPASWVRCHLAGGRPWSGAGQSEGHSPGGLAWLGHPCSSPRVFISQAGLWGSPHCLPILFAKSAVPSGRKFRVESGVRGLLGAWASPPSAPYFLPVPPACCYYSRTGWGAEASGQPTWWLKTRLNQNVNTS